MRPYNTYRYLGTEIQEASESKSDSVLESLGASTCSIDSSLDVLRTLSTPITVDLTISSRPNRANKDNEQRQKSAVAAKSAAVSPVLGMTPTAKISAAKTTDNTNSSWKFESQPAPSQFREPPILARVSDFNYSPEQLVSQTGTVQNVAVETPIEETVLPSEKPIEQQSFNELMASAVEGIEKMRIDQSQTAVPVSESNFKRWSSRIQWGKLTGFFKNKETLKLSSLAVLTVVLVFAGVSYKANRDASNNDELVEFGVPAPVALTDTVLSESNPASKSDQLPETSAVASNNAYSQAPVSAQASFTDQMRQESTGEYSSPEIFAAEDNQWNSVPEARATFAISGEESARQIMPPHSNAVASYPVANNELGVNQMGNASMPAWPSAGSPEIASVAPAIGNQYNNSEESYSSPTLTDDFESDPNAVPYTAASYPTNSIR